jgi:hypothetical protein
MSSLRAPLITLQQAIDHLRLPITPDQSSPEDNAMARDLTLKMAIAQQIILDYLKDRADESWEDESTTPPIIQGAILQQLAEEWKYRGDNPGSVENAPKYADGQLSEKITNMLRRYRDPALA